MSILKLPQRIKLQITYDVQGVEDIMVIEPPLEVRGNYPQQVFLVYNKDNLGSRRKAGFEEYSNDNNNERDLRCNSLVLATGSDIAELQWSFICDDLGHQRSFNYHKIHDASFIPLKTAPFKIVRNLEYVISESNPVR